MKHILIFSDTHGYLTGCERVIRESKEKVDAIIHAGDCTRDADRLRAEFPSIDVYSVKGNCDMFVREPEEMTVIIDGVKIFITHGHLYNVKLEYDYGTLKDRARRAGADMVVFGHTHKPCCDWDRELTVINPGSSGYFGTYAEAWADNGKVRADMRRFD